MYTNYMQDDACAHACVYTLPVSAPIFILGLDWQSTGTDLESDFKYLEVSGS